MSLRIAAPGADLEAVWDLADHPERVAVLCHPHPRHGGTMNAPLMVAVARHLRDDGYAVLRFNFRGVGSSTGTWDGGAAEVDDVAAAVAHARSKHPELPLGVAGWSFGAAVALRWQARDGDASPYAGIAPPVRSELTPPLPPPGDLQPAPRRFILGDRDQFIAQDDLEAYAHAAGGTLHVLGGSDHFFYFREDRVAGLVGDGLRASG